MEQEATGITQAGHTRPSVLYWIWVVIILATGVVFASMVYIYRAGRRLEAVHGPLRYAVGQIRAEGTAAQLWFEEAKGGERTLDSVLKHLDQADWYANVMLEGGQDSQQRFVPLHDRRLREEIEQLQSGLAQFREVMLERWEGPEVTPVASEVEGRFKSTFGRVLEQAGAVENELRRATDRELKKFGTVQTALICGCLVVTGGVGWGFTYFVRGQLRYQQRLRAANQQLEAMNQQLRATEQQLRAANQQLQADEQQLRAANQQLRATEQQLRAANQQLQADEQQLRAANQQLQAMNQQLRASQEEIALLAKFPAEDPNPVMRVTRGGTIIYANEASESLLNCWGCKVEQRLPEQWARFAAEVLDHGKSRQIDVECGGSWWSITFAPVTEPAYVNIYALNITGRRRAEEELRRSRAELEHTSRLVTAGEMTSGLAHELNQPLCAIANFASAGIQMARKGTEPEKLSKALEEIASQARRAGEIIRRLRRLVSKREPERTPVDINKIAREVIKFEQAEAYHNNIEIKAVLARKLPEVIGDDIQLQQVVLNLVRNGMEAMKETPPERRQLVITTKAAEGGGIELAVRDNGEGLSEVTAERMFDSFFSTKPNGLGVGLSLSRSIVETHGGKIWAEPNPDGGVTLRFRLPAKGVRNG